MRFVISNLPSVVMMTLILLVDAQRSTNNLRDVDFQELARQNKITKQILEAFIQKKLGLSRGYVRPPSVHEILPRKVADENRTRLNLAPELEEQDDQLESQDYSEDDSLQSVESEQIDSIYSEGNAWKHLERIRDKKEAMKDTELQGTPAAVSQRNPPLSIDSTLLEKLGVDANCSSCNESDLGVTRWTMPLIKSGEKRYYLGIFFKANWFKAQHYCRFHGMHLASISSQQENDKLEQYVKDSGLGHEHFWTSGTDLAEEGNFYWMSNGRPLTYVNWNSGEPNNFRYENGEEENCLELWNRDGKGLKWNDSPCSFETYFICEVRAD